MKEIIEVKGVNGLNNAVSTGITIVDFWATWCMPCRMQAPILVDLKNELGDKINIAKVNIDEQENEQIAIDLNIVSIPTLAFYVNGELKEKVVGLTSNVELKEIIDKYSK